MNFQPLRETTHENACRVRLLVKLVTGESLPTWACMEAVAAEVLSAIPLDGRAVDGMGPLRLSREFGVSMAEARSFSDDYFST